ncbi:L-type lectin-domain containing receptor kinase S.6 [Macadamia integrifolia]|uniref:L-type lectin-domain containing receptor kinase S.6 n=1 Tax=Macadamia integrifolia TaxID=60698 RepID=UPI001C4E9C85|nr:L-type lectin-domain containing receptor kinase S.6 [Macadamia integrifolia]
MVFSSSWLLSALLFPLLIISTSLSLSFALTKNVTLLGDASFRNGSISLTQEISCAYSSHSSSSCGAGRALCASPIRFLDAVTNTAVSFWSRFSFSVIPSSSSSSVFGDGLTFMITSSDGVPCHSAGHMGLLNCATNKQESFVAVEFDTNLDPSLGDLNDNHVALDINSVISFASVDAGTMGISLKSGRRMTAWIEYRDREKMLRVWLSYSPFRPAVPILDVGLDLSDHLQEFMHVGFSASNGRGSALHLIDKWQFRTYRFLTVTPTDTGQGEGEEEECCFTCSGDDLAVDNGSSDHHKRRRRKKVNEVGLAMGGTAAFLFSMAVVVGGTSWYLLRKRKIEARGNKARQMCRIQMKKIPTRLSLAEIKAATKGFKQSRIVGEGASGTVYEGTLASGGSVAVKRFNWRMDQNECLSDPFMTELATMLGCLRHKNLVQLQGWCCEGDELLLVYEFMPGGSLHEILHHNKSSASASILTLEQRLKIVLGVASALTYLHEECDRQIIHRDVKACNIMLDAKLNPKLGDFGLAEVYEHSRRTREAITPAGTIGYLAPEYAHSGVPTVKTDVYSFGVLVLEVVTGRLPVDEGGIVLVDWVWDMWAKGKLKEAGDGRLMAMERLDKTVMVRMLMVGLSCVHPNCLERPTVREAVRMLRGEVLLPNLPARKPVLRFPSILPEGSEEILQCGDGGDGMSGTPWATPRSRFS